MHKVCINYFNRKLCYGLGRTWWQLFPVGFCWLLGSLLLILGSAVCSGQMVSLKFSKPVCNFAWALKIILES